MEDTLEGRGQSEIEALEEKEWLDSLDHVIKHGGAERVRDLLRSLQRRAAEHGLLLPSAVNSPARNISPMTSMMPDPQMPVTPLRAATFANLSSSDQALDPMTLKRGSRVSGSMRTRSMAPGAARWPLLICAPSKAGPVGLEQAISLCRLPSTISALVPTSTISAISSRL